MSQPQPARLIRFGVFEVEPHTGTLRKRGVRIHLQEQPFKLLLALVENPGELITRDELQRRAWPETTYGDVDHGLNIAINKIREALGDSAEAPRFTETIPRRGYRFIAPIEGAAAAPVVPRPGPATPSKPGWLRYAVAGVAGVIGAAAWLLTPSPTPTLELHRLTHDTLFKYYPIVSDGARLYFSGGLSRSDAGLYQLPVSGGEPVRLPLSLPNPGRCRLIDITPDRQDLLIALYPVAPTVASPGGVPLWTIRIADGTSRRVGDLAGIRGAYSPDGTLLAFTREPPDASRWIASSDGSNPRRLTALPNLVLSQPVWSHDGRRIAIGTRPSESTDWTDFEIPAQGGIPRRMFPGANIPQLPAAWTPEGSLLFTSAGHIWISQPPRLPWFSRPPPIRLSTGEPEFLPPTGRAGSYAFVADGTTRLGQLQRLDPRSGSWLPHLDGISAEAVEYSRDGQRVSYSSYPRGELFVRRTTPGQPVQLTAPPMRVLVSRWSPDGTWLAFLGLASPLNGWRIYLVNPSGGVPRLACPACDPTGDFTWAPDGKRLVYAAPAAGSVPMHLAVVDLDTGSVTRIPGSEGRLSPRWSPDGSMLATLTSNRGASRRSAGPLPLAIYRVADSRWDETIDPATAGPAWPCWSPDSRELWYYSADRGAIMRYRLRENSHELVVPMKVTELAGLVPMWFGLTASGDLIILRSRDLDQIYALDLKVH